MDEFGVEIEGLEELERKLDPHELIGKPARDALTKAAIIVQNQAKLNASGRPGPNVVTGRLRSSISFEIDAAPIPSFAKVKTNVIYAAPLEFGNRRWKPGVKYPFLYPALEQSHDKIDSLLIEASKAIEENFSK